MMSKALALLLVGLVALNYVSCDSGSGESHEQKKRRQNCGDLLEEPAAATNSPATTPADGEFHSQCPLILALYNMSATLTTEQRVVFEGLIQEIEVTFLANVTLTSDEKICKISILLAAFFESYQDIYVKLSYYQIASWGTVIDFLYVSVSINIELTQAIITLDASGECLLTEAIENATKDCSAADKANYNSLIVEIKGVLGDASLTYEEKLAALYEIISAFIQAHPDLAGLLLTIEIEGFGWFAGLGQVSQTYWRITQLSTVLSGSNVNDCPLLEALQAAYQNTSYNTTVRAQIYQLIQTLVADFQVNVTISSRLKVVSAELYQFFKLEPWMISIIESIQIGDWGTIYDLIFCSGVCTNDGCGNLDPVATTTVVPTTKATTAAATGNCATIGSLIVISASNTTILTDSITAGISSWDSTTKNGFSSTFNKIKRDIWNDVLYNGQAAKLAQLHIDCSSYNSNNPTKQAQFYAIVITGWGTIGQFVACGN